MKQSVDEKASWGKDAAYISGMAVLYYLAARFGLRFAYEQSHASPVWPPDGLALASLLLVGWRIWPGIWLGALVANAVQFIHTQGAPVGTALWVSAAIALGSTLSALIGWRLSQRWFGRFVSHGQQEYLIEELNVFRFASMAFLMSLPSAFICPAAICAAGFAPWSQYSLLWTIWWIGDAFSIQLLTPFLVVWSKHTNIRMQRSLLAEGVAAFAALIGSILLVFGGRFPGSPLLYLTMAAQVWIAVRFGPRAVATALVLIAVSAIGFTVHQQGPFAFPAPFAFHSEHQSILLLQVFLWVVSITSVALASSVASSRRNQERFMSFMQNMPGIAFIKDSEGKYLFVNERLKQTHEKGAMEWIGRSPHQLWPKEIAEGIVPLDRGVLESGKPLRSVENIPQSDGLHQWLVHRFGLRDVHGRIEAVAGLAVDITDLKRAEEALRAREAQLYSFVQQAPAAMVMFDRDMNYLAASKRWSSEFGRGHQNLVGRNHYEVHPDLPDRWKEIHRKALAGETQSNDEDLWIQADGSRVWTRWSVSPWVDVGGKIGGIIILSEDITARMMAETALRESERRERERATELAALLDAMPTPVFIAHDPDCLHITGNHAADLLLQMPRGKEASLSAPEETKPRHFRAVKDGRNLSNAELPAQRAAHGIPVKDFEFSLVFEDGTMRDVLGYGTCLRDDEGRPRGAVHVLIDITERKRAERQAKESLEKEVVLRREINHRVKNNLQVISSLLYLQYTKLEDPRMRAVLRESQTRVQTLSLIYDRLSQRGDVNGIAFAEYVWQLAKETFEIYRIAQETISLKINAEGIFLDLDTAVPCGLILSELISNALKYAFPGGRKGELLIDLHSIGSGRFCLTVHDNGVGLPDRVCSEGAKSMGLELVRDLTSQLKGRIAFQNRHGTTVTIEFPAM